MSSQSRIDPLSWGIRIDDQAPSVNDPLDAWKQLRQFPVMRKVLHESIHFWHSVCTDFGIRLAFDSLKSMNALRIAALRGEDLMSIGPDWTFEGYQPFSMLYEAQIPSTAVDVQLSAIQIYEGLARFWELFIFTNPKFEDLDEKLVSEAELYGAAYMLARQQLGKHAPFFFPIVGYLSLCNEKHDPVYNYVNSLKLCSKVIDDNELNLDALTLDIWSQVWRLAAEGKIMFAQPNAPLTTYQLCMKRLTSWKSRYANELGQMDDSWIGGHPILEPYANAVFSLISECYPDLSQRQAEERMPFFCAIPAAPDNFKMLVLRMCPPLVTFNDGKKWVNPPPHRTDVTTFENGLRLFSDMMGAAMGFVSNAKGATWQNLCPCSSCPIHDNNLCMSVMEYPDSYESCNFRSVVLQKEFHI